MENKKENKKENRSLLLYTALIFLAAILIIVVSFFSQVNMEKKHNEYTGDGSQANSITEKTAQLSEENMILLETTRNLNQQNTQLYEENEALENKIAELEKQINKTNELCTMLNLVNKNQITAAKEIFYAFDPTTLTESQLVLYNHIKNELE